MTGYDYDTWKHHMDMAVTRLRDAMSRERYESDVRNGLGHTAKARAAFWADVIERLHGHSPHDTKYSV